MKEGWTYKKLGEVCEIFGRIGFRGYTKADLVDSPNDGAITLSPSNIVNGEMNYSKCSYITWAKYEESPEIMICPGDILLVKTASVGKTALVRNLPHKATINPQFVVFKNIKTNNEYLSYYMKSEKAQKFIWSIAKGAAAQTVSQKNLAEMQIPTPPLSEQKRIVERLDSTFAKIDALKANAEKQLDDAKALFQKALEKAMEPKEGWEEKTLGDVGTFIRGGNFSKKDFVEGGFPCIHYGQIHTKFGVATYKHLSCVPKSMVKPERCALKGDLVIAITSEDNEGSCKCTAWMAEYEAYVGGHTSIYKHSLNPIFISYYFRAPRFQKAKLDYTHGFKVVEINPKDIAKIPICVPPLSEQQAIVSRLDSLSEKVKKLQEIQDKTIKECDALKQAILREVFE